MPCPPSRLRSRAGRPSFSTAGRRGTDVVKAITCGADAVAIGRPYVWGLAVDGSDGVRDVVRALRRETEVAMALVGAATLADITADLVVPHNRA
ncbi:alpha-hydroxy-acid oxidizing protein [Streptomyces olivoreticuli]